jgi:hypothetical protein
MKRGAAMSITVQVPVPDELIPFLERKARSAGLNWEDYLSAMLSRELTAPPTVGEILAGFRAQVTASGISDRALDDPLCANMTETSRGTAISEQGGKENQHGNNERFCPDCNTNDGSFGFAIG